MAPNFIAHQSRLRLIFLGLGALWSTSVGIVIIEVWRRSAKRWFRVHVALTLAGRSHRDLGRRLPTHIAEMRASINTTRPLLVMSRRFEYHGRDPEH